MNVVKSLRIVFMGTPEFAVPSLDALNQSKHQVVGVVTVPDRQAGRGRQLIASPVKQFAVEKSLPLLQPEKLKDPDFLSALQKLEADLFVVVAFRMLPEQVWSMPQLGTFNLHASLLPQYRGAAPINWVIINAEEKTGITTFLIDKEIDTGRILFQEVIRVHPDDTAGDLHDRMMLQGARLVVKTADALANGAVSPEVQEQFINPGMILKPAPKIFKETCLIRWNNPGNAIHNLIRGLSPYPAAYTTVSLDQESRVLKIYKTSFEPMKMQVQAGTLEINNNRLSIAANDGWIHLLEVQMEGKKRMSSKDFLRGIQHPELLRISD